MSYQIFAVILVLCGVGVFIYSQQKTSVVDIEIKGVGKISAKAKEDGDQIAKIRLQVEEQRATINAAFTSAETARKAASEAAELVANVKASATAATEKVEALDKVLDQSRKTLLAMQKLLEERTLTKDQAVKFQELTKSLPKSKVRIASVEREEALKFAEQLRLMLIDAGYECGPMELASRTGYGVLIGEKLGTGDVDLLCFGQNSTPAIEGVISTNVNNRIEMKVSPKSPLYAAAGILSALNDIGVNTRVSPVRNLSPEEWIIFVNEKKFRLDEVQHGK